MGLDGYVMDIEGNIWIVVWGVWKVVRIFFEGEVMVEVKLLMRCIMVS